MLVDVGVTAYNSSALSGDIWEQSKIVLRNTQ